jgi:hypothetical protein
MSFLGVLSPRSGKLITFDLRGPKSFPWRHSFKPTTRRATK